jgi:AbrB family looped-hinge helix DNA binding protein
MELKLSTRGQLVLPGAIRRELGLLPGDSLDAKVQAGRVVLTPRKRRFSNVTLLVNSINGHLAQLAGANSAVLATLDRGIPQAFLIPEALTYA